MLNSRRTFLGMSFLIVSMLVALAVSAGAESSASPEELAVASELTVLKGCIGKAAGSKGWVIVDAEGTETPLAASEQIAMLEGHSAELAGSWTEVDGDKVFAATDVKDLGTC